jgi:TRAP-type C4-dicarboxylate transport system substrate-binding protein
MGKVAERTRRSSGAGWLAKIAVTAILTAATLQISATKRPALAQTATEMKISIWLPPSHPLIKGAQEWASAIEEESKGTLKFKIFPSEQLGKAIDHYDLARDGIVDVAFVATGYQPGRFPIINVSQIPFIVENGVGGSAAIDAWYRKYADAELKDVHFCLAFIQDPGTFHSRTKKIVVPGDIAGMRIRPSTNYVGELVTLLGGTNVASSAPEARMILERGTADAITFPWGSVFLFGIDNVTKYHLDAPLFTAPFAWVINKSAYNLLNADQKKAVDDHCTSEWAQKLGGPWAEFEAAGRAKMRAAPDQEVYSLTPEQLELWRKASEPLMTSWQKTIRAGGGDPDQIFSELRASLVKYKASY